MKEGVGWLEDFSLCARLCRLLLKGRKKEEYVVGQTLYLFYDDMAGL